MVGRTHDLAAFTALSYIVATRSVPEMTLATALVALGANFIGGLTPDIDQPTANLWHRLPAGSILGKLLAPLLGGHRFISHSIFGIVLFGLGAKYLLAAMGSVLLVNMQIVWAAFMIAYISHLVMDSFTHEGVPWLFPLPVRFGFPPLRALRIKTGGMIEKAVVFPGLLLLNVWIFYTYHAQFLLFLHQYIK